MMTSAPAQGQPPETISRRRHFAQVPDELATDLRLSDRAVRLWMRLDKYAGADGAAFPSRERLAKDLGCSVPSISRALSELVAAGWITRSPRIPGGVWNTTLNDQPTDPGSPVTRPRITGDTTPDHPRSGEGDPPKDTKERTESSRVAAPQRPTNPRSDWRGNDRQLWADTISAATMTSDASGPWAAGTFPTAAFYDAFRKGSSALKAKRWPGIFLTEMDDWEDYLAGLGITVG